MSKWIKEVNNKIIFSILVLNMLYLFILIGLVTEEELQGSRTKRFPKKAILPVLSLEGKFTKQNNTCL